MAVRGILEVPDERLRVTYSYVKNISTAQGLIDDTFYASSNDIGLAAPQIGCKDAVIVIDISERRDQPLILVNPEIVAAEGEVKGEEAACLFLVFTRKSNAIRK